MQKAGGVNLRPIAIKFLLLGTNTVGLVLRVNSLS